ncbi:MAG: Ig-like domain-containing protein, partial [Bacteroidota bacterium]|nr:Ig-like domain-containing protein [Bacteroidota bacterium]
MFPLLLCLFISSFAQNAIVTENAKTGNPNSEWDLTTNSDGSFGDHTIQGYSTDISVNKGATISFKIDVNSGTNKQFGIKIYRLGYYQGNGARLVADLGTAFTGVAQNACGYDNTSGLTDCGNWTINASWAVPSTAVSGIYIAKLTRSAAGGGGSSHIAFIVRDDASTSALFFKTSDATWQAYNGYGGNSLYVGPGLANNHGSKVSYNRPFITRDGGGGGGVMEDWLFNSEYPMIRFLERNGYDISYTTDVDVVRSGNLLLNHKVFMSVGHDEYWSKEERNSVEAARAAGKHLAFFSGNEVYWKTRWENSTDGTNTPNRTMVCYKEGTMATPAENACGGKCDPTSEWTGLWRDGCSFPNGNACKPENSLSGEISWDGTAGTITVPAAYKGLRFWRNTTVASLGAGQTATLAAGTLGYEWDWEQFAASNPPGRMTLSSTSLDGHVHKLSLYKSAGGGLVFGAGTVQWAWGLDANHDRNVAPWNQTSTAMQQATINLFADMGVQPATLQTGLTAARTSTDVTAPVTVITSPANNSSTSSLSPVTITGTATDANTIAGVELSFDGGATWFPASGTSSWTYTWTPPGNGVYTIKARGIDDSGNFTATASSASIIFTVGSGSTPNCPCTVFGSTTPPVT